MEEAPMSMAVFTTLETPRLRLRHFRDADLALFMAYRNDPEVARYQGWEGISEPEARAFLQEQKEIQPGVPGQWFQIAIERKETGMLVGDCALKIEEHDERQAERNRLYALPRLPGTWYSVRGRLACLGVCLCDTGNASGDRNDRL